MKIGILGGTFDPIHNGHLALAKGALSELGLDQVLFMPSGAPPHKAMRPVAAAQDRFQMVKLALEGKTLFQVSRMEIDRPGPAYTIDTLRLLRAQFGRHAEFVFLVGTDCLAGLGTWYCFGELVKLCRFTVISRPGFPTQRAPAGVHFIQFPTPELSSSELRLGISRGEDVRSRIPQRALDYILKRGLYKNLSRSQGGPS